MGTMLLDVQFPVTAEQTGGQFAIVSFRFPGPLPGGPGMHVHKASDETFIVVEGEIELEAAGETHRLKAGETLVVLRGTPHKFKVVGSPTLLFCIVTPGEFDARFRSANSSPGAEVSTSVTESAPPRAAATAKPPE